MGKKRQIKKHRRELAAFPPPKKYLMRVEAVPGIRAVFNTIDKSHAKRADFLAFSQRNGSPETENEIWAPSVYIPSGFVMGLINPDVRALIEEADYGRGDLCLDDFSAACDSTEQLAQEVTAMSAWRVGQGIYQFDADMLKTLLTSDVPEDIPVDVFRRLPEWCVYVEFPLSVEDGPDVQKIMEGFFVYCDQKPVPENDVVDGMLESLMLMPLMRALKDPVTREREDCLFPIMIPLLEGKGASACIEIGLSQHIDRTGADEQMRATSEVLESMVRAMLPIVLYLCSDEPDVSGKFGTPTRGKPATKLADRFGPSGTVKQWTVGARFGSALRKHKEQEEEGQGADDESVSTGQRRRPHVRKAHFHGYWYGPRQAASRDYRYKWLSPTLINVGKIDDIIPTTHEVY